MTHFTSILVLSFCGSKSILVLMGAIEGFEAIIQGNAPWCLQLNQIEFPNLVSMKCGCLIHGWQKPKYKALFFIFKFLSHHILFLRFFFLGFGVDLSHTRSWWRFSSGLCIVMPHGLSSFQAPYFIYLAL